MRSVSVIMGVYRPQRDMLARAVESVQSQTLPPLECILCDDGSGDGTYEYLLELADRYENLVALRHPENRGLAAALNTCLDVARGDFIARQDDDDYSDPSRFARQMAYMEDHPDCAVVGTAIQMFAGDEIWAVKRFPERPEKESFLFALPFLHGTMLFRREILERHRYQEGRRTRRTEDYELLMRLYAQGHWAANLQEPLYFYREDPANEAKRTFRYRMDEVMIRARGFSCLGLFPRGIPYVVKPLVVGMLPKPALLFMKKKYYRLESPEEPAVYGGSRDTRHS